jgi:hypothetical protein
MNKLARTFISRMLFSETELLLPKIIKIFYFIKIGSMKIIRNYALVFYFAH